MTESITRLQLAEREVNDLWDDYWVHCTPCGQLLGLIVDGHFGPLDDGGWQYTEGVWEPTAYHRAKRRRIRRRVGTWREQPRDRTRLQLGTQLGRPPTPAPVG